MNRNRIAWMLVDWFRDNRPRGWILDTTRVGRQRVMRLGGVAWHVRHHISVGWRGYHLVFSVDPFKPLTLAQEGALRRQDVYEQISSRITHFGYEGGWKVLSDEIVGRWSLLATDLHFAMQELNLLPKLRFLRLRNHGYIRPVPEPAHATKHGAHRVMLKREKALLEGLRGGNQAAWLGSVILRKSLNLQLRGVHYGVNVAVIPEGPDRLPLEINVLPWVRNSHAARLLSQKVHRLLLARGYQGDPITRLSFAHDGGPDYWHGQYRRCVPATPQALAEVQREITALSTARID